MTELNELSKLSAPPRASSNPVNSRAPFPVADALNLLYRYA